jgi:dCMP deaminase
MAPDAILFEGVAGGLDMAIRPTWDRYFLDIAETVSTRSKDPRTKVGAVLVKNRRILGTGYNGFPSGINDDLAERWEIPIKYSFVAHAERNALDRCAADGVATGGCTVYITLPPCTECAKSIIQCKAAGIVVANPAPEHWKGSSDFAIAMLEEANLSVVLAYSADL